MRKPRAFDRAGPHIHSPRLAPWDPSPPTALAAEARGPGGGRCSARGGVRRPPGPTPPADPGRGGGRRDRGGPIRAGGAPPAHEGQGCGPVRAPDVGVHGDPRAPLRRARSVEGAASGPLPDQARPRARGRRAAERPAPAGVRAARRGDHARPRSRHGPLGLVHRAASGAHLDPAEQPGPVRRAPRGRWAPRSTSAARSTSPFPRRRPGGRPRRAIIDERWMPAGRESEEIVAASAPPRLRRVMVEAGEAWGRAWPALYSLARRQPVGGDALPALRHLGAGGACCSRSRAASPARAGWAYALTLGFALVYLGEHYADRPAGGARLLVVAVRSGRAARRARLRTG